MNTRRYLVKILEFMGNHTKNSEFSFYNLILTPKQKLENGQDLAALKKHICTFCIFVSDKSIRHALDLANNLKYIKPIDIGSYEYGSTKIVAGSKDGGLGIQLTEKGADYLAKVLDNRAEHRSQIWITLIVGVIIAFVTATANYFINKADVKLLQTQVINIENQIKLSSAN